jgi:hypothetical protein
MYRRDYFKGVKGIVKRRLNWRQIQNDIYRREAKLEEDDDIIDEKKLFYMGKHNFDNMINRTKTRKSLKRKPRKYRQRSFEVILETERRLVIPYEALNYLESTECDIYIDYRIMGVFAINERNQMLEMIGIHSLLMIVERLKKIDV